jgi:hypothetical protein
VPNLTVKVAADQPPVVELLLAPTEARSEALRRVGLDGPRPVLVRAMIDTGARDSLITRSVADELGLEPTGMVDIFGVGERTSGTGAVFRVRLFFGGLPSLELVAATRVVAVEELDRFGVRMLLGRDLLSRSIRLYNGPSGLCTFAF